MNYKNIDDNNSADVTITTDIAMARIATWALDFYNRMCLGQVEELGHLVRQNLVPMFSEDPSTPVAMPSFDMSDSINDVLNEVKRTLGYPTNGSMGIGHPHMHMSGLRAYELQKVIQKALAYDREEHPAFRTVDYDGIIVKYTQDPDPTATITAPRVDDPKDNDARPIVVQITSSQAQVLAKALDLYTRICLGKFEVIADMLRDEILPQFRPNAKGDKLPATAEQIEKVEYHLFVAKRILGYPEAGSMGINHGHVNQYGLRAFGLCKLIDKTLTMFSDETDQIETAVDGGTSVVAKKAAKVRKEKKLQR